MREDDDLSDLGLTDSMTLIRVIVHAGQVAGAPVDFADHDLEDVRALRGLHALVAGERPGR